MRPPSWNPPVELSDAEKVIVKRIKRAKLFIFLRHNRHEIFDEESSSFFLTDSPDL